MLTYAGSTCVKVDAAVLPRLRQLLPGVEIRRLPLWYLPHCVFEYWFPSKKKSNKWMREEMPLISKENVIKKGISAGEDRMEECMCVLHDRESNQVCFCHALVSERPEV